MVLFHSMPKKDWYWVIFYKHIFLMMCYQFHHHNHNYHKELNETYTTKNQAQSLIKQQRFFLLLQCFLRWRLIIISHGSFLLLLLLLLLRVLLIFALVTFVCTTSLVLLSPSESLDVQCQRKYTTWKR